LSHGGIGLLRPLVHRAQFRIQRKLFAQFRHFGQLEVPVPWTAGFDGFAKGVYS